VPGTAKDRRVAGHAPDSKPNNSHTRDNPAGIARSPVSVVPTAGSLGGEAGASVMMRLLTPYSRIRYSRREAPELHILEREAAARLVGPQIFDQHFRGVPS
jgi:hypothetical protein